MRGFGSIPLVCAFALSACGDASDAPLIWDLANDEVHRIHVAAFATGAGPAMVSSYDCAGGGSVEMTLSYEGGATMQNLTSLLHSFNDCKLGETFVNGTLDYLRVSFCDDGTPNLDIEGTISLTGELEAECELLGTERCGKVSGTVCGEKAR